MNDNFAKLIAMVIVGGVAKSLFGQPPTATRPVFETTLSTVQDIAKGAKS